MSAAHVIARGSRATCRAAERGPEGFSNLLLTPGVGAHVRALAMGAELMHGHRAVLRPGAIFIAHGGKDRHPFPVPIRVI